MERMSEANRRRVQKVCEKTGWDFDYAKKKMLQAKENVGANFEYYLGFKLWEFTEDEQRTFFLKRDADLIVSKFNTNKDNVRVAWNKSRFIKKFGKYLGRICLSTSDLKLEEFIQAFKNEKKIVYKPSSSSGGAGIKVYDLTTNSIDNVYREISLMKDGVVEGFIKQHPDMQKLSVKGVNTIRMVTLYTNESFSGIETNKAYIMYAAVRMCQGDTYFDNAHQGGMVANINLDTAEIETDAFDYQHRRHTTHPDTGVKIKGFKIPYFSEAKKMLEEAAKIVPGYFGWDVAITENGPVIVEMNSHPGAEILQLPFVPERKGMRYVMEKLINAKPIRMESPKEPEKPYGLKISDISKDGIEFYWKKLSVADGYEVFRGYAPEGPFELIYRAERRNIGTYRDNDFDHDKKIVYYTVRSFVRNNNGDLSFSVKVPPVAAEYVSELRLDREATYLYDGTTRQLKAVYGWGEPQDGVWSSTNESIAKVSTNGEITGIASGACDIVYESESAGGSVSHKVVVNRCAEEKLHEFPVRYHKNLETGYWENASAIKNNTAVIMMVGDLMCGKTQMNTQYTEEHGWDFCDSFEYVREITKDSDLAVGNLETLLASGWPYMTDETYIDNFNNCNATSRYLEAVQYGGFDAVIMSNNHNCDGGIRALQETIEQVDRYDLIRTGAFRNEYEERFFIADVNGIRVGFLAYMSMDTGFNGKDIDWNEREKSIHLNIFSKQKAQKDIEECRRKGAEYVIAYMHWGKKNFRKITRMQEKEAHEIAEAGADYIIGSNPHLVQVYDLLNTSDGRKVPCFYSVGNFQAVMNQVQGNRESVLVRICLRRDAFGKVRLMNNHYIPCHTYRNIGKSNWAPVAVSDAYNTSLNKIRKHEFYSYITSTIGSKISIYTKNEMLGNVCITRADKKYIDEIILLYRARIKWLQDEGYSQWKNYIKNHPRDSFLKLIQNREYYVLKNGEEIIGGFCVNSDSESWRDKETDSYYLSRGVTKIGYSGIGRLIADYAKQLTRDANKHSLRLECLYSNKKLNDIWDGYGFAFVKDVESKSHFSLREWKCQE